MIRILFFLLLFATAPSLGGQALRMEYFTVNDGLSTREINDLYIGADGFLWVATMDGLNRFDGQGFRVFGQGSKATGGLSRGAVASVRPDNDGKFIVRFRDFYGYFDRFDPVDFSVEQVRMVPSTGVLGYPRAITTDEQGSTFVVTIGTAGTYIYEYTPGPGKQQFTVVYHAPDDDWLKFTPRVELLTLNNRGFLLYDEKYGFRHLSSTGQLLSRPFAEDFASRRFYAFAEGADDNVYLSFRAGPPLFRWQPEAGFPPLAVENLDYGLVYPRIFRDKAGQLLLQATEDILGNQYPGEYYLIDTLGQVSLFEAPLPTGIAVTAMSAQNFRETVYLGLREGLGVVERYVNPVTTFLDIPDGNVLNRNIMGGICEDNAGRTYFLEQENAVYFLDTGSQRIDTLTLARYDEPDEAIAFRAGVDLVYDRQTHALWGTGQPRGEGAEARGGLLFRHDIGSGLTKVYRSQYSLGALCFDEENTLWIAASDPMEVGLLLRFDRVKESFHRALRTEGSVEKVNGLRINYLYATGAGEILLGTGNRGLLGYAPKTGRLHSYALADTATEEERNFPSIYVIHGSAEGRYWWLGTEGGLYRYHPGSGAVTRYGRSEGLSSSIVYGLVAATDGGFWVATQNGLTRVPANLETGSFRRYYREDGLSNDQFQPHAFHRNSRDGRYFFGGSNGLTAFRESDLSVGAAGADVMLTEIEIFGREGERTIPGNLSDVEDVRIEANEKSIAISFALPAGQLPSSSQFRYMLEGFSEEWRTLTNERTIRFNNLAAGTYTLRIQGAGANGNFGDQETRLRIHVRQSIIEKPWFQIMLVATFAALLIYIIQGRLRERLRNEQLRTQLSSDIHDEVSGLLAGITLQAELLKNKTDDESLRERLDRVGQAGRSAMSKMSDVIWSIDSRRDTIGNLLQRMQEHADEVLLPLDIRYNFRATGFDKSRELPGNIRQDVYFIFKEAINNIARHSNATRVEIELTQAAQVFELFIRDNGRPPPPAAGNPASGPRTNAEYRGPSPGTRVRAQKAGQGNDNMRMRAARLKGEITIDERRGYTIVFRMRRLA